MIKTIAVLLTCHNRREKTLACLTSLYQCHLPEKYILDAFLVDDGSTDRTTEAVQAKFPDVNIIEGNGNLFWNQGMRLAWQVALNKKEYDFYIWLNDDTILFEQGLNELFFCYQINKEKKENEAIITGACQNDLRNKIFSYGGRNENGPVIPNGQIQPCKYINGNIVVIPKEVYAKLGNLSSEYTHTMGDFDYGLRAAQAGIACYITRIYVATCPKNEGLPDWCNSQIPIVKRWKSMYSPKGLNIKEYFVFHKKHSGWKWIIYASKAYLKVLFPNLYKMISFK